MKNQIVKAAPPLLLAALLLAGCAAPAVSPAASPWPTHAPDATPYVRTMAPEAAARPEAVENVQSIEVLWGDIYEQFGHFYAKKDELELFRSLPQEEPYSFVPHSPRFSLDEGEAMRMARLFDGLDGVEARVIAMHQIVNGLDDWDFLTVLTMTPARLAALSEEVDEMFMLERFWPSVEERFDIAYWPDGIYADADDMLRERFSQLGCFYFEPAFFDEFQALPAQEPADFVLTEFTPSGWSEDGQRLLWQLQGREGLALTLRWRSDGPETLAVVTASPARLIALSEELGGRYQVSPLTEEQLAVFDRVVDLEEEVPLG